MTTDGWAEVHALLRRMGELGTEIIKEVTDALQRALIESALRGAAEDPRSIGADLTLLAVGRHLERVSDSAADIADLTVPNAESDSIGLV